MIQCWEIKIYGKVQGVWYRASTQKEARRLGLSGYVQNEADGSVFAVVEGNESQLKALEEWCKEGPPFARVEKVITTKVEIQNFDTFEVRR